MLTIDEYIAKRKQEDQINEFDMSKRSDNTQACVSYVFEYFNNYLDITEIDSRNALDLERINRLQKLIDEYDGDVQKWLLQMYADHGHYLHRLLRGIIDEDELFLLYSSESEFRAMSYECYSSLVKKHPYLKSQTEMLFRFIKDHQRVRASALGNRDVPFVTAEFAEWIEHTEAKYGVSMPAFACSYAYFFCEHNDKWPVRHRKKLSNGMLHYDHRQKGNLFNIDTLFSKCSRKPFVRGHKQDIELLIMYYWLQDIDGDEEYWGEYLEKVMKHKQEASAVVSSTEADDRRDSQ